MKRPQEEIDADLEVLLRFLKKSRTMAEMTQHLQCDERTVYRRLKSLQGSKYPIVRVGSARPTKYQLI